MKIKLAVYSSDRNYVEHLVNYLDIHHNEKMELSAFDEEQSLKAYLRDDKADIVLVDERMPYAVEKGDIYTVTAYLTENPDDKSDKVTIFKYQKGELIYKRILDLYASGAERVLLRSGKEAGGEAPIHLFLSLNGGAGASTVAKAYAMKLAAERKTLYLNLEAFGDCETVLKADGNISFKEVLYALKSRRGNLTLKLESALKKNPEGVFFYAPSENPADLLEMTEGELGRLLAEMRNCNLFDEIVLDMDSYPSQNMLVGMKEADDIWMIADGTGASDEKYRRFMAFISGIEQKNKLRLRPKMKIFYNKYSSRTGKPIENSELETIGGSPRYEGLDTGTIVKKMASTNIFDKSIL